MYDGGSTDNTSEIIKDYPVEMFVHKSDKVDDRQLMHFRNEGYKQWRTECDWFIVCDIDEFLFHPNIHSVLYEYKKNGITLPRVEGFEMLSKEFPVFKKGDYLPGYIRTGSPNPVYYNKHLIFDPILDIKYMLGCHQARPTGPVKLSDHADFKNLHHKVLSYEYFLSKAVQTRDRLSDWNKEVGAGFHYAEHAQTTKEEFLRYFIEADNVFEPVNQQIAADAIANFIASHLLQDTQEYRVLDLSNWGRYPSAIGKTFEVLQKKFGGRHVRVEHPSGAIEFGALRAIANLDSGCNTVYLDASMLKVDGLLFKDALSTLLSLITARAVDRKLLVLIDLKSADETASVELMQCDFLLREFNLTRSDGMVLGTLKAHARND